MCFCFVSYYYYLFILFLDIEPTPERDGRKALVSKFRQAGNCPDLEHWSSLRGLLTADARLARVSSCFVAPRRGKKAILPVGSCPQRTMFVDSCSVHHPTSYHCWYEGRLTPSGMLEHEHEDSEPENTSLATSSKPLT